jgi:hypothetical protein
MFEGEAVRKPDVCSATIKVTATVYRTIAVMMTIVLYSVITGAFALFVA